MSFQVPDFSSSPPAPSTPDRKSSNLFSFGASNPSTTPAGPPPPSSARSFTPTDPPPPTFGSSMFGSNTPSMPLSFDQPSPSPLKFGNPDSSPLRGYSSKPAFPKAYRRPSIEDEEDEEEEEEEEEEEDDGDYMDEDDESGDEDGTEDGIADQDGIYEDGQEMDYSQYQSNSELPSNQGDFGRSMISLKESMNWLGSKRPKEMIYRLVARELYIRNELRQVAESDDLVLHTEDIISRLYKEAGDDKINNDSLPEGTANIPGDLIKLWNSYQKKTAILESEEYTARIGPGPRTSGFTKADFLADLTLHVYHPQADVKTPGAPKPLPQTMLEWLNRYHDPYPTQLGEIRAHRPSPANHPLFWDTIFNSLLRGKVAAVVAILKNGGWRHARGGIEDIRSQNGQVGYTGVALSNVEKVMGAVIEVLSQCPASRGDWNTRSGDWTLFRIKASQALHDLKRFAEGNDYNDNEGLAAVPARSRSDNYSTTAKKARSLVPWFIYQRLISLYNFVMGERHEIISNSQDWCEATFGLLAWWDEGRQDRQVALGKSRGSSRLPSRVSDAEAHLRKLRKSFEAATSEATDLHVNTSDPVEVGLASLLEGDCESVIGFLSAWSGPISSAVAEIGSLSGWLPPSEPQNLMSMSLDEDDLKVLGLHSSPANSDSVKDKALIIYSQALKTRGEMKRSFGQGKTDSINGWELAIAVLGRLDSAARSEEIVGKFVEGVELDSSQTVDRLWMLLTNIGMRSHAENITEKYADKLDKLDERRYGEKLWYYALSHKASKVNDVLFQLISKSLIHSIAFPPGAELDNHLERLISSPKSALAKMSELDVEAAELLQTRLSGYATLRQFYILRDKEVVRQGGAKISLGAGTRQAEALSALMTVIISSDDTIRGGLYDEERGAVVNVKFLLALLGEALPFVLQPGLSLAVSDIDTLMMAIEDVQAVGRAYLESADFLGDVLAQGPKSNSPIDLLRKSTSNLSATSSFSMVGSSMLQSQPSIGSSGVLVKGNVKRGWDWREILSTGTTPESLLRVLRLGLANKLAESWLAEVDRLI